MKKKLEAELMSIAHRVLQMKNKSDINQLCIETQRLHEKLSILRFVEEHFGGVKPTIGQAEIVEKMKQFFDEIHIQEPLQSIIAVESVLETEKEEIITSEILSELPQETQDVSVEKQLDVQMPIEAQDENIIEEEETITFDHIPEVIVMEEDVVEEEVTIPEVVLIEEEVIEEAIVIESLPEEILMVEEKVIEDVSIIDEAPEEISVTEKVETAKNLDFLPAFELDTEEEEEKPKKAAEKQISFMDFLGVDFTEPTFVKVTPPEEILAPIVAMSTKQPTYQFNNEAAIAEPKLVSLNDKFAKGINIGLNDRIAFVKNLFGNSDEDYNRVMNQIITYVTFEEAQNFIDDMVKPDYNNWIGKEDYSKRFMEIIEKKFA